jgi:signal transduction histidine kinase
MWHRLIRWLAFACSVAGCLGAPAFAPYDVDEHTLHLWHLDEETTPFTDSGLSPTALKGLFNGANQGMPSLEGFGTSISFLWHAGNEPGIEIPYGPVLMASSQLELGEKDNVSYPFPMMGENGAFTIEAIVKLDMLPSASPGYAADIVTMDDDNNLDRVFLFRIEKPGFLSFVPIVNYSVRGGGLATIPVTGDHAINTRDWFHVAVTYDGNENVADNLKLFWTRLGSGAEAANQIGRGTLSADLYEELGDFAIGNSGKFNQLGPFEFFPGCIDEVRISGIARRPHDFFFVSPEAKRKAGAKLAPALQRNDHTGLMLAKVLVDDMPVAMPASGSPLVLDPGSHRLDFDFGFLPGAVADPLSVKCRLEGMDDDWHPTARGMTFTWEMLNEAGETLGSTVFSTTRTSSGWESDVVDSKMERRHEPLFIPHKTRRIRVSMSSGPPDTTGCWVIDNLSLTRSIKPNENLWYNGGFDIGERTDQIGGIPEGWKRGGSEPAGARLMLVESPALGLLDAGQENSAIWTCTQDLQVRPAAAGETFLLGWSEAFNVISGSSLRASYVNVPSGHYQFRAIAVSDTPSARTTQLAFPIIIRQPFWKQAWFLPATVAAAVILIAWGLFINYRRRSHHRLASFKMANALERDRARIARDMHDDLGTRVSLMKHAASVVRETIDREPGKARHQALRLESAASDLVRAMDGLVWAVNPANDTLEHVASHLSGVAQEIFRDAPVRLRISIPTDLPAIQLRSDYRHHFALAVKEALHNILKHAGPCEASLQIKIADAALVAVISDNGKGFDPSNPKPGNGLNNLHARAAEMHATCEIQSTPGQGTRVFLRCPLPEVPLLLNP